jgi:hypothetical protein
VEHRLQVLPAVRRIAQAEACGDLAGQPTALQIPDCRFGALQLLLVVTGRIRQHLGQVRAGGRFRLTTEGRIGLRHRHADPGCEVLHRVDEAHPVVLHQEADGGAVRAAAETVIKLLGRAHRERRRLLGVERTAGGVIGPGPLQLHRRLDNVDDVDAGEQVLDEGLRNHGA